MTTPRSKEQAPVLHKCPVCQQPQTRIQRRLDGVARGSTIYVCARSGQCILGMDLTKVDTWVSV